MASRLKDKYLQEVVPGLRKEFNYANPMQVPAVNKIVINIGMGEVIQNPKAMEAAVSDLSTITGQRPVITRAKRSVAAFKLREGMQIGCMVTLRGDRMYYFLDKLISAALPRLRDFQGVSADAFDGRGNYTLGLREQLVFPEIDYDKVDKVRGMEISVVTTAHTDQEGRRLLALMGMPFKR
ncbi:MAG TPA: 50S ribosomal protein L5 [Ktedonobacteraceae bacterium]|jgi:large subunit ribosomal protein L5|nr:50S ribosomal protein L5 [Ktedonobacteraceae bacterium]